MQWLIIVWRQFAIPECALDASHIVLAPVLLGHLFLAEGDTSPRDPHHGHAVIIILDEFDILSGVMTGRPLLKSPRLDDPGGLVEFQILAGHISVE